MTECTLHNLLTSCQYPQVFWIYQMNDYDENILLTKGTKQEMLEDDENSFDLIDHINDVVEYWTIREDGAMFVRIRMDDRAKELFSEDYVKKWDRFNPLKRPYLYTAELDDFTNCIYGSSEYLHPYGDPLDCHHFDKADRKTENSSEKPNNCEHITEDGVTCAKYPACDDCLDNPLNKVKGSKRLLKGKDEPQTCSVNGRPYDCGNCEYHKCTADEPQTNKEIVLDPSFAELSDEQFVEAMKLIEPQTDCPWK